MAAAQFGRSWANVEEVRECRHEPLVAP
jgi:hypothetical protein